MIAKKIDQLAWSYSSFLARFNKKIIKLINRYCDYVMSDNFYFQARMITKPLHWIWICEWLAKIKKNYNKDPFSIDGVYVISGLPGSGKSSLCYEICERLRRKNGKGSYINTAIERKRIDYNKMRFYKFHKEFKITDFFYDNEIKKYPNHFLFNSLHIDEAHRVFNYRNNMQSDYKSSFIPFMNYAVGVRQYIKKIFLYTQLDKVDIQLQTLACKIYNVRIDKKFDYETWIQNGKFEFTIAGWYLDEIQNNKVVNTYYIERTFDLDYFDTFNLQKELDYSKFDKVEVKKL